MSVEVISAESQSGQRHLNAQQKNLHRKHCVHSPMVRQRQNAAVQPVQTKHMTCDCHGSCIGKLSQTWSGANKRLSSVSGHSAPIGSEQFW